MIEDSGECRSCDALSKVLYELREQVESAKQVEAEATMKLGESLIKIGALEEQVERLTKERDIKEHCIVQLEAEDLRVKDQLAAIAEQNEKMRSIPKWIGGDWADSIRSLHDLATPVLNKYRAEGMEMAAGMLDEPMDRAAAQKIRAQAAELEKTNG